METTIRKLHFIGIGGAGMSAIAHVMIGMGFDISGSDIAKSETTYKLEQLGAVIHVGHRSENVAGAEAVVISSAIGAQNPELTAARQQGLPVYHRADMLAYIMRQQQGIAIAGAHGKTTTTSMIAMMLAMAGTDPTVLIGGDLAYLQGNARLGRGPYAVAEADESDGSFLKLAPRIAVVTNIENDHLDYYGTMENILHTFGEFLHKLPVDNGLAVLCYDNAHLRSLAGRAGCPVVSYAIGHEADYMAHNIRINGSSTIYEAYHHGSLLGTVTLSVPGRHNVANSLAAIAVGRHIGLDFHLIAEGLEAFQGAKRRFQTKGRVAGVWVVDDYAHHPTEISTTLAAARDMNPKRLICVFQPHRYSRTKFLYREFGGSFGDADQLILTDIYAAGEEPIEGVTGELIQQEVAAQTGRRPTYIADKQKIPRYLEQIVEAGDLVITMGAGDIYLAGEDLVEKLTGAE